MSQVRIKDSVYCECGNCGLYVPDSSRDTTTEVSPEQGEPFALYVMVCAYCGHIVYDKDSEKVLEIFSENVHNGY